MPLCQSMSAAFVATDDDIFETGVVSPTAVALLLENLRLTCNYQPEDQPPERGQTMVSLDSNNLLQHTHVARSPHCSVTRRSLSNGADDWHFTPHGLNLSGDDNHDDEVKCLTKLLSGVLKKQSPERELFQGNRIGRLLATESFIDRQLNDRIPERIFSLLRKAGFKNCPGAKVNQSLLYNNTETATGAFVKCQTNGYETGANTDHGLDAGNTSAGLSGERIHADGKPHHQDQSLQQPRNWKGKSNRNLKKRKCLQKRRLNLKYNTNGRRDDARNMSMTAQEQENTPESVTNDKRMLSSDNEMDVKINLVVVGHNPSSKLTSGGWEPPEDVRFNSRSKRRCPHTEGTRSHPVASRKRGRFQQEDQVDHSYP